MDARLASCFAVLAALASGCLFTPTESCGAHTDCSSCASAASCGWCASSGRCVAGSSSGPTLAICGGGWAWLPSSCSSTVIGGTGCSDALSCGTCTPRASCGWCASSGQCLNGTASGPNGTTCASGWAWVTASCGTTVGDARVDVASYADAPVMDRGGALRLCTTSVTLPVSQACQDALDANCCAQQISCDGDVYCRSCAMGSSQPQCASNVVFDALVQCRANQGAACAGGG